MAKRPTPESIAAGLNATERLMLFCLVSQTDWLSQGDRQKGRHEAFLLGFQQKPTRNKDRPRPASLNLMQPD